MPKQRSLVWPVITAIVAVLIAFLALPQSMRQWAPGLRSPRIHFGLDLAGGTQLDFRISEQEMLDQKETLKVQIAKLHAQGASAETIGELELQIVSLEEQQRNVLEAIRTVLERRINSLGVSEATITPSVIGAEKHLLVECPGVIDVQQCIATVGKTIKLEFKEEFTEVTDEFKKNVEQEVADAQRRMSASGITLTQLSEDLSDKLGVANLGEQTFFKDMLPKGLEDLWTKTPGSGVFRRNVTLNVPSQDAEGNPTVQEVEGIFLSEVTRARTQTGRTINEAPKAFGLLAEREEGASYTAHEKEALGTKISPRVIGAIRGMQPGELQAVTMEEGSRVLFLRSFVPGRAEVDVSHILITYAGATQAKPTVTRTKAEAMELINRIKTD